MVALALCAVTTACGGSTSTRRADSAPTAAAPALPETSGDRRDDVPVLGDDGGPTDPEAADWAWLVAQHPEVARFQRAAVLRRELDGWLARAAEGRVFDASCDALDVDGNGTSLVHRRVKEQKTAERRRVSVARMKLGAHTITTTWSAGDEVLRDGAWQKSTNEYGFDWTGSGMASRADLVVARVTQDVVLRAEASYTLAVDCASGACTLTPRPAAGDFDFGTVDPAPAASEPPGVRRTRAIVAGLSVVDPHGPSRPWLFRSEAACRAHRAHLLNEGPARTCSAKSPGRAGAGRSTSPTTRMYAWRSAGRASISRCRVSTTPCSGTIAPRRFASCGSRFATCARESVVARQLHAHERVGTVRDVRPDEGDDRARLDELDVLVRDDLCQPGPAQGD